MRHFVIGLSLMVLFSSIPFTWAQDSIGTEFVSPQASAAVVIKPQQIRSSPLLQMVPWQVVQTETEKILGVPADRVVSVLVFAAPPGEDGLPIWGAAIKLSQPAQVEELLPALQQSGKFTVEKLSNSEKRILRGSSPPMSPDVYPVDETTFLLAPPATRAAMLRQAEQEEAGPLVKLMQQNASDAEIQAYLVMAPIQELARFVLSDPALAEQFPGLNELPQQLVSAKLVGDFFQEDGGLTLTLTTRDPQAAATLQVTAAGLLDQAVEQFKESVEPVDDEDPRSQQIKQNMLQVVTQLRAALEPKREGATVTLTTVGDPRVTPQLLVGTAMGSTMAMVAAMRDKSQQVTAMHNLKQVIYAMHYFHDNYKKFPSDSYDATGKPLLSWRVHLLPYLEQKALYQQFRLDEPWDSEHNRKLASIIPAQYTTPRDAALAADGKTRYLRPLGEGLPASVEDELTFGQITDGTSNTLAVVEIPPERAVIWTKPDDVEVNLETPLETLAPGKTPGFLGARYDGSVQFFSRSIGNDSLRGILTHAGGEVVRVD